jgi:hypothetical protein
MQDPNSFDKEIENAQANSQSEQGTETETTVETTNPTEEAEPEIDYRTKFAESAKEAQRLYEENKRLKEQFEAKGEEETPPANDLYPGFEELDPEAQANLIAYTDMVTRRAMENVYKDPAIAFAKTTYNETKFDKALAEVVSKYPNLVNSKDEFKNKYFNPNNTPDNIDVILEDMAKIHLFDKAKDIGIEEEKQKANRIDLERSTGGEKVPTSSRSLEDWHRMMLENPAQFAKHSKEYNADLNSGKLK